MNRAVIVEGNVDTKLPEPMTPADCDLRDFQYMELDVRMLRDSRFAAQVSGDGFRAGVLLWCASWHQVPAGSLPDDDIELANLAGYGRFIKEWKKIREEALYGFVKCSDGRLFHPTISEKVCAAWKGRLQYAHKKLEDRLRKENKKRISENREMVAIPSFDEWQAQRLQEIPKENKRIPAESNDQSEGIPQESAPNSIGETPENALRGKGRGKGIYITDGTSPACDAPAHMPPRVIDTNSDPKHRFTLPADWEPSPSFPAEMFRAGVNPDEFLTAKNLDEFVSYRRASGESKTQALWEHALLQRLIAIRDRAATGGKSHANSTQNRSGNPQRLSPFQRVQAANPLGSSAEQSSRIIDVTPE